MSEFHPQEVPVREGEPASAVRIGSLDLRIVLQFEHGEDRAVDDLVWLDPDAVPAEQLSDERLSTRPSQPGQDLLANGSEAVIRGRCSHVAASLLPRHASGLSRVYPS